MGFRLTARATAAVLTGAFALLGTAAAQAAMPSDLGPVGWSSGSGDPNLGVLNDGTRTLNFDGGWRFKLVNTADTSDASGVYGNSSDPRADAPGFDDSGWQQLTLPHDWSITQAPDPSQSNATGYFPGGLGWYRKTFTLPASMTGKRIALDFDGVFENSYVYLNGQLLGNHPYGYTGYSYDVSGLVHTDGHTPNVLAVVVQNQEPSSRWYSGSGITRHVHLTVADPLHIARWGTTVTTPDVATTIGSHYATAHVATQVANDSGQAGTVDIHYLIRDASGHVVADATSSDVAVPADGVTSSSDIRLDNPHLWSTTDPYLYTVQTDITQAGARLDSATATFGVRWLVFNPTQDVMLNGQPLKLHGVDLHNDEGALGSVDNYDAMYRQMSQLKAGGVNAFRTSHNPPSPELIDICQRLGIVMMVEAFDAWDVGKLSADYHLFFNQWSDYDIEEMVNEAKNSPAVIMWSIGNEIPDWTSPQALPIEQRLIADIRSIDTTRPIVAGSDRYRSVPKPGSVADQMVQNLDGLGLNYDTAKTIDGLHAQYPTKFFFESESSSETSTRGYYQDPNLLNTGQNFTPGKMELSSYDNNFDSWTLSNQYDLQKVRDRQFFAGQFIWSGWDYIGEPTPYTTFPVKTSFFGLVDTAGFPKDGYYLFQSQWTSAPMVHIVPMNWTDYQPGQTVQVWAYANEPTVELFLNGRSLGAKSFTQKTTTFGASYLETNECTGDDKTFTGGACPGSYQSPNGSSGKLKLIWNVPFQPGRLVAVAKDASGHVVARDEQDTAGRPYGLTVTPDKTVLRPDGKSLSYLTVRVVDRHGVEVPDADNSILTSVRGAGAFAGADNGKEDDAEGYVSPRHDAFNGQLLSIVESATHPGPITVKVSSDGLLPDTITLYAQNASHSGVTAVAPAYARTVQRTSASLPTRVQVIHGDGTTALAPVSWSTRGPGPGARPGTYAVTGSVRGTPIPARAIVTVAGVAWVQRQHAVVPVGMAPQAAAVTKVVYSDGVTQYLRVSWPDIPAGRVAQPGRFSVRGHVDGISVPAMLLVTVTRHVTAGQNLALAAGPAHPAADADFSGGVFNGDASDFGTSTTVPAALLDGNTTSGGWSNRYGKGPTQTLNEVTNARPGDWVSVSWPKPETFGELRPYFTVDAADQVPAAVQVSYWDGLAWVPVRHQHVQLAGGSDEPSSITFDPVSTTKVKLEMTSSSPGSPTTGNLTISELQVIGDVHSIDPGPLEQIVDRWLHHADPEGP
jgi:beta-galactosidase